MKRALFLALILACVSVLNAQEIPKPTELASPILDNHEAKPGSPYGTMNPKAPAETSQFGFMIGVFDCVDQIKNPADGKWFTSKSVWTSSYILNGFGVQDRYWSAVSVSSSTRVYDPKKGKWIVTYFQSQPAYATGVWEGMKEGENMIMRQTNGAVESRLTFSNISETGFDWIGERVEGDKVSSGWKISCKKR